MRPPRPGTQELAAETGYGQLLVRSLVRAQLTLALRVVAVLAVTLGGLPLAFALAPGLGHSRLFGLPLPWLVLGGASYPLLLACGAFYVRAARRNERDFVALVRRERP